MRFTHKRLVFTAMILLVLAIGVIVLTKLNNSGVEISPSSVTNKSGPIVIKSPSKVDLNSGTFSIQPTVRGEVQVVDEFIIFWPAEGEGYNETGIYKALFTNYKTSDGVVLKIKPIEFTINRQAPYSDLQNEVLQKYGKFEKPANKFLDSLPYTKDYRFQISYAINEDSNPKNESANSGVIDKNDYTVIIETLVIQGSTETLDSYISEVLLARQEALEWISNQGIDIHKDINYVFVPNDEQLRNPGLIYEEVEI